MDVIKSFGYFTRGIKHVIESFGYAIRGIKHVIRSERNARIHLAIAIIVLTAGLILNVTGTELAAIFFAIIMVFLAEIANTAFEKTLDLIEPNKNESVREIKDVAAGAVLVAAIGAAAIGFVVFRPYIVEVIFKVQQ